MAIVRDQPYGNARFLVTIADLPPQQFDEVLLPELSLVPIEYREGGDPEAAARKLVGRPGVGVLVLRRGFRGVLDLYEWWRQGALGDPNVRRAVTVQLQDEAAANVVAEWRLRNAWPSKYSVSPLEGRGCALVYETVEVSCDSLEMR